MSYEKTCTTCACNWVCDHNNNGFETCGNWIPKWISVEERLPEPFEDVLTRRACGIDVEHYEGGKSWRNDHTAEPWPVTHWMPLPEPLDLPYLDGYVGCGNRAKRLLQLRRTEG